MTPKCGYLNYPVRPAPLFGESLPGYCWRFFASNGHFIPAHLKCSFGAYRVSPYRKAYYSGLIAFFGTDLLRGALEAEVEVGPAARRWDGADWVRRRFMVRHCPECVRTDATQWLHHELPLTHACTTHGCWLISACTACGNPLRWNTMHLPWRCRCGLSIAEMTARPAPAWLVHLANWVQNSHGTWIRRTDTPPRAPARLLTPAITFVDIVHALARMEHCRLGGEERYLNNDELLSCRGVLPTRESSIFRRIVSGEELTDIAFVRGRP